MDDFLVQALEFVKAQASVRQMDEEEIASMVKSLAGSLRGIASDTQCRREVQSCVDAAKSIKEKSITCLECGKVFKIISSRHLAAHGLSTAEYKAKWGLKAKTPLLAKTLLRERRKRMKDLRPWEKRKKA